MRPALLQDTLMLLRSACGQHSGHSEETWLVLVTEERDMSGVFMAKVDGP